MSLWGAGQPDIDACPHALCKAIIYMLDLLHDYHGSRLTLVIYDNIALKL